MESDDDENKSRKRKQVLEAQVTAGCGYGKAKKRRVTSFWNKIWPRLVDGGWTKEEGSGSDAGSIYFLPPGVKVKKYSRDKKYYNRIKSVIDRILEKRNKVESEAADAYRQEVNDLEDTICEAPSKAVSSSCAHATRRTRIDLNWKDERRHFPKLTSRIGETYQAMDIPSAGTDASSSDMGKGSARNDFPNEYEQVWDPQAAESSGKANFVHLTVPHNKKEAGMVALHARGYELPGLYDIISNAPPLDGSDWSSEEKQRFRRYIFEERKNIHMVSKRMGKSVNNCLTYYLGTYKQSDDYRLLKAVCAQERKDKEGGYHHVDQCGLCQGGGNLLICEACESAYHLNCLRPPLKEVPEDEWYCDDCLNQKLLDARSTIMKEARLFKLGGVMSRKESREESNVSAESAQNVDVGGAFCALVTSSTDRDSVTQEHVEIGNIATETTTKLTCNSNRSKSQLITSTQQFVQTLQDAFSPAAKTVHRSGDEMS